MITPKKHPFEVIYEDNHLLIVNKPAGLLVQGDRTGDKSLVDYGKEYLKNKYNKPGNVFLGVVHRLDRPVSGIVVLARTSKALERMNRIFKERNIDKTYWAVVDKVPPRELDDLVHWIIKDKKRNMVRAYNKKVKGTKRAQLRYRIFGRQNKHYLIEIFPETGRAHQIRVQIAAIGCPVRGDVKYGFRKPNNDGNINLHARSLKFEHPVKKQQMNIKASLPEDEFWQQFVSFED